MQDLTDRDLSRLMTLQYVHGGEMRHIPHGVGESFDEMEKAGVVDIDIEVLSDGLVFATYATINNNGKRVAEAGMKAMREMLGK